MQTRKLLSVTLACIAIASSVAPALAADPYPSKPITIIYPYASGSASDALTRMVGEILHKALGQPVIVESKPGAGGATALEFVTRAPADGYTLVLSASGTMAVNPHIYNLRYKPVEDLVPITVLVDIPFVVVTNVNFPAKNLKEFITQAKARPGEISFGNAGIGTQAHITQVMLAKAAGIDVNIVAYKGGTPAVNDLMGGHLDAMIDNAAAQAPHIQSRKVNPLFVTSKSRVAAYPNVPTAHEAGLEGFSAVGWFGLAAPKGTPTEIIKRLNKALVQGFAQPDIQKRLIDAGWVPVASTPTEATARAKADLATLGTIARLIGLKQN